ncbi:hypothetical protein HDG38_001714 [Paraburkholderia sp. WSM4177]|nr:hypothetical protein [Paraburkholderia sp. WSM4177]MBB5483291.1 hypothetical protein [Paraburkholderia sp. WSM4180]
MTANRYSPPQVPKTLTFARSMRGAPTPAPSPRPAAGPFRPAVAPDVYHSHLAPFLRQRFPHCRTLGRDPFATRFRTRRERRPIRARARFSQLDAAAPRAAYRPPTAPGTA